MPIFGCPQGDTTVGDAPHTLALPRPRPNGLPPSAQPASRLMDDDEIRELYREHGAPLFRYVLSLTARDRYAAEDVVQETLLRAWQNSELIARRRGSIRPWLFTVARNIVVDRHRAKQARPPEVGDEALATSHPIIDDLDSALTSWTVQDAVASLNKLHQQVLIQIYFRGNTVAEAAVVLGVPAGTVKSRTYYAMRALRAALIARGLAPRDTQRPTG
jgi:RNA polymerase sigma-70 factor, ECF subfamily